MEARDKALDGLRGIAILLVLATHLLHLKATGPLSQWIHALARAGWIGVDLFFVLSGFLITRILVGLREEPGRAQTFYGRRALRILPAYYAYLGVSLLLIFSLVEDATALADTRRHLPGLMLFGQNLGSAWLGEPALRELRHLWSLAVEEQFYLLWPWLVWWLRPARLADACLAVLAFCWACKLALWLSGAEAMSIYYFTLTRMDGFAVGGFLAARLCRGELRLPRRYALAPVLAGLFLLAVFLSQRSLRPLFLRHLSGAFRRRQSGVAAAAAALAGSVCRQPRRPAAGRLRSAGLGGAGAIAAPAGGSPGAAAERPLRRRPAVGAGIVKNARSAITVGGCLPTALVSPSP